MRYGKRDLRSLAPPGEPASYGEAVVALTAMPAPPAEASRLWRTDQAVLDASATPYMGAARLYATGTDGNGIGTRFLTLAIAPGVSSLRVWALAGLSNTAGIRVDVSCETATDPVARTLAVTDALTRQMAIDAPPDAVRTVQLTDAPPSSTVASRALASTPDLAAYWEPLQVTGAHVVSVMVGSQADLETL